MSVEGRARRRSDRARGGAGAAAPEHPKGSESRQLASHAPQRERPRRPARRPLPQCPRPSKGRAWTRLSKCGASIPAPHTGSQARRKGLTPGTRPQRALGPSVPQGFSFLAGDSGDTERDWAAEAVTGIDPADRSGLSGKLPKPSPEPESLPRSRHPELQHTHRCRAGRVEDEILPSPPFVPPSPGSLPFCPFGLGKGVHPNQKVPGVSDSLLPGPE